MKHLHSAALGAYWLWREIDKQRQGEVFNVTKLSRIKFKHAIRKCKKDKSLIALHKRYAKRIIVSSGKEIKHHTNSKVKLPTNIEGVHGDVNIG